MDKREIVTHLCSRGHRGSTTNNERWASIQIKEFLGNQGLPTEVLSFKGNKTYGERLAVHLFFALVASSLPFFEKALVPVSLALFLFLILSFVVESMKFVDLVSRIFPKGSSANVLGKLERAGATKRIIFVAHYDSQKEGLIFAPKLIEFMKKFASPAACVTPIHLTFLSILGLFVTTFLFVVDLPGFFSLLHLVFHILLMAWASLSLVLVLQWMTGKSYVPGANDNATGVAVMLDLARKYSGAGKEGLPRETDFWFLATGCEETGLRGALAFIKEKREELEEKETYVLCLDGFGYGNLHYFTADGILKATPYDKKLTELARELAEEKYPGTEPFVCRVFTDGLAFSVRGFRAITFGSLDKDKIIENYHWRTDTPENVDFESVEKAPEFVEAFVERLVR